MRMMLSCCDLYASDYNIIFNADKSKFMLFSAAGHSRNLNSSTLVFLLAASHLNLYHNGHIISDDLNDRRDIKCCHDSLIKQINNVLRFLVN